MEFFPLFFKKNPRKNRAAALLFSFSTVSNGPKPSATVYDIHIFRNNLPDRPSAALSSIGTASVFFIQHIGHALQSNTQS